MTYILQLTKFLCFYSTQFSIFVQVSVGGKFMPMKKSLFDPRVPVQVLLLPPLLCRPIDMTAEE
jgi:hypothetical protein